MGSLFLFLGYMGVPVAFSLIAAVLVVTAFTPVSYASMMAQLFNGMNVEALVAIPFFLLVGDLMTSANVTVRMIRLAQSMVGHLRGGLAQDRKSTRLNSSHPSISYAVFCLKKKTMAPKAISFRLPYMRNGSRFSAF